MTVLELINLLESMDPTAEVRIAMQPSWPLQERIANVCQLNEDKRGRIIDEDDIVENWEPGDMTYDEAIADATPVVYIAAGGQLDHPYAPRCVWDR